MAARMILFVIGFVALVAFGFLRGLDPGTLINLQALIIVFGGMALVLLSGYPAHRLRQTAEAIRTVVLQGAGPRTEILLPEIVRLAKIYRIQGPLALEKAIKNVRHDFLRFGTTLIVEGYDRWALTSALDRENMLRTNERRAQIGILRTMTRLAPALGMAGTVVSLMQVLGDLRHPEDLGVTLGLALTSTLYGVLLANLVFLPLSSKLEELAHGEVVERSMIVDAMSGLHNEEHPLRIAERLNAYEMYCQIREAGEQDSSAPALIHDASHQRLEEGLS